MSRWKAARTPFSAGTCASELLTEPCTFLPQSASDETEEAAAAFHFGCRCGRGRDWELSGTLTGLPDQIELLSGGTVTLVSSFQPAISPEQQSEAASLPGTEHISYTISYASSDEAVLQIDSSGVLTAGQAGEAELTCSVLWHAGHRDRDLLLPGGTAFHPGVRDAGGGGGLPLYRQHPGRLGCRPFGRGRPAGHAHRQRRLCLRRDGLPAGGAGGPGWSFSAGMTPAESC